MKKSFAEAYPELISEWAEDNEIAPGDISYGSNKKIIWKGFCGHIWEASIKNRGRGSGCPYCSGNKVLKGFNDLESLYPDLADEWAEPDETIRPDRVTEKANREITWKCGRCGQTWRSRIADRTDGHGCPVCSGEKLVTGINDLETLYPETALEWSEKNDKKPSEVWPKSRENVHWKCSICGFEWNAVVNTRVKGSGCPECRRKEQEEKRPYGSRKEEREFKLRAFAYYASKAGMDVNIASDELIGVPLDIYFPEQKAAVIFSRSLEADFRIRRERAINWLCLKSGVKLYRILPKDGNEYDNCICITLIDGSKEVLGFAIQTVFDRLGIKTDVDLIRDVKDIKRVSI
ncbi:MAG: zinc-ribbon domain-containing protein [Lachnospiraceae bacterium]|nr:zinc-ribbon domain-containing protein [Lachnospiraceae bacterium]